MDAERKRKNESGDLVMRSKYKITHPFWQVLGIGALAGMRTSSAPVITTHILSHHQSKALANSPLSFMQSKTVANTLKILAISELVADKLPSTPNRTNTGGLVFRGFAGALAGASIYKASGNNIIVGASLGAASAIASTYASFILRKTTVKATKLLDPIIGGIEDALVIGVGIGLTQID